MRRSIAFLFLAGALIGCAHDDIEPLCPPAPSICDASRNVFFEFGKADLTDDAKFALREFTKTIFIRARKVQVIGFVDNAEAIKFGNSLGLRRAAAVKEELIRNGLKEKAIEVRDGGTSQPFKQTPPDTPEPLNRRVLVSAA